MKRILSLSGGGFRGYFTALLLAKLEEQHSQSISQQTDFFAGTSIGGILALGLASGKTPAELTDSFFKYRKIIFQSPRWPWRQCKYSQKGLKHSLYDILGKGVVENTMGNLPKPAMVTVVCLNTARSQIISSIDPDTQHWRVIDAALATSAAPTYFPAHTVAGKRYIDGGTAANIPDIAALHHFMKYQNEMLKDIRMLSVGTTFAHEQVTPYGSLSSHAGIFKWAKKLVPFFMDAQRELIVQQCEQAFNANHYIRLDWPTMEEIELDDTSDNAIKLMKDAAQSLMMKHGGDSSVVTYLNPTSGHRHV